MPRTRTVVATLAALTTLSSTAQAQDKPGPDGHPPFGSLTSPSAALKVAFEEVCVPAILDRQPVEVLAVQRYLVSVNPRLAGFSGEVKTWRLGSLGKVYVAAWADGTCSVTVERGDPDALKAQALAAIKARGIELTQGSVQPAQADGVNVAYCGPPPQPIVLGILSPSDKRSRRPAIFLNLFRAKGDHPSLCNAAR
ncbi:MAG TPA: hypothetical protein VFN88_07810 [Caulobacteraceae bacterium]|nr:hypothetical protein [Caulobacteraceae bacterium]